MDYERENKRLKHELEDRDYAEQQRRDQEYAQREEDRRRRKEEWAEAQCVASSWDEAFHKGLPRYRSEAREELQMQAEYPEEGYRPWFPDQVAQIEFAQQALDEEMREVRRQIALLEQSARNRAAQRVDDKFGRLCEVSEYLRSDNYNALVNW